MNGLVPVMIGGAFGAGGRYVLGSVLASRLGTGFPWGTLAVNLVGGLLMGLLAGVIARGAAGEDARLLLGVGVLGGFTTFSAFGLDVWTMVERNAWSIAGLYVAVSVVGAVAFTGIGLAIGRAL